MSSADRYIVDEEEFQKFINPVMHRWLRILYTLGITLVPLFFILDFFTMPIHNLPDFAVYRISATVFLIGIFLIIKFSKPGHYQYIFGYLFSLIVGGIIVKMTEDLGGFNSSYYAGLNLVLIAVNLLLPWHFIHSIFNGLIIILMYVFYNFIMFQDFEPKNLVNNLFFMAGTVIITSSINHVQRNLNKVEFNLRKDLSKTKDALWGEMEIAKKIQVSLLPDRKQLAGGAYSAASIMIPADEVGGDYYDLIEDENGNTWVAIGDVSGHGVESGLIMMMAQTSIKSLIASNISSKPSDILVKLNRIMIDNIKRLNVQRYMTLNLFRISGANVSYAGRHQDLLVYRHKEKKVETISEEGTWIGIFDDIEDMQMDHTFQMDIGDVLLLYTDGITEAENENEEMFGYDRLERSFLQYAEHPSETIIERILNDCKAFQEKQNDDITLLILKKY